jgi:cytochrome c oxidase subunit 1
VVLCNTIGLIAGAVGLVIFLINLYIPSFHIDALIAKNLIYFFSHLFINATIYMAVIATYEVLPRYSGRPIRLTRGYLFAWSATALLLLIAFPHHLFMDYAMPVWAEVMGEVASYAEAIPVLAVTAIIILNNVYLSGLRWDMASRFLYLAIFGWLAGIIPAVVDATIAINQVTHNTLWVDGHFHFYLLLGVLAMIFGFMYYLSKTEGHSEDNPLDRLAFWAYIAASLGFVGMFLYSGVQSVPRRWAVHLPQWVPYDQVASLFAVIIVAATLLFVLRFLSSSRAIVA